MKKAAKISLKETFAVHVRAIKDMRSVAPGCFLPFVLYSIVKALAPYATIWLSAQLVNELASLRRPEVLGKWVIWIIAITASMGLLKAILERWKNVNESLFMISTIFCMQKNF